MPEILGLGREVEAGGLGVQGQSVLLEIQSQEDKGKIKFVRFIFSMVKLQFCFKERQFKISFECADFSG